MDVCTLPIAYITALGVSASFGLSAVLTLWQRSCNLSLLFWVQWGMLILCVARRASQLMSGILHLSEAWACSEFAFQWTWRVVS